MYFTWKILLLLLLLPLLLFFVSDEEEEWGKGRGRKRGNLPETLHFQWHQKNITDTFRSQGGTGYIDPNNPQQYCEVETILFLQIQKLGIQEVKKHAQNHAAKIWSWDLNQGLYDPKFSSLCVLLGCQNLELHISAGGQSSSMRRQ